MNWLKTFIAGGGYGLSLENPVRCGGGPAGERKYLSKLRCPNGQKVEFSRTGSMIRKGGMFGIGASTQPVDAYVVQCACGKHKITVFMDMYTEWKESCIGAEGWTLVETSDRSDKSDWVSLIAGSKAPEGSPLSNFMAAMKTEPKLTEFVEKTLQEFGDDPIPKIIEWMVAQGLTEDAQAMGAICMAYIGIPAIPALVDLLGNDEYKLGMVAAKTLAGIEGSLPALREALKSENAKVRLHAAGALQFSGPKAVEAAPDLGALIEKEIADGGEVETGKVSKVADIATSALGKIGEAALPVIGDLLKSDNANVRIAAVCASLPCGKSALPLLVEARAKEKDPLVFVGLQNTIAKIGEEI